jgi:hypothetical protein
MKTKAGIIVGMGLCMVFAAHLYAEGDGKSPAARLPGVRVLGGISEKYNAVAFDHSKHVVLAGNCAACHHHGNGNASSCKECHKLGPSVFKNSVAHNFMACSNCHSAADRDNPAMPGLKVAYHKKCFECHRGMGNIGLDPKGCAELCHAKKIQKADAKARTESRNQTK